LRGGKSHALFFSQAVRMAWRGIRLEGMNPAPVVVERNSKSVVLNKGEDMNWIDDHFIVDGVDKETAKRIKNQIVNAMEKSCLNCGSRLGIDCGEAEPDYDENYCSEGCYKANLKD